MTKEQALEKILPAYMRYYDVDCETPLAPFDAVAVAHIHDQQYVLVKKAKVSETYSNEFVYFALAECLAEEELQKYVDAAWEDGLSKTEPVANHRSTDITVVIIADSVGDAAAKAVKKLSRQKSYSFGFRGYNNLRVMAHDLGSGRSVTNRRGTELLKVAGNIKE